MLIGKIKRQIFFFALPVFLAGFFVFLQPVFDNSNADFYIQAYTVGSNTGTDQNRTPLEKPGIDTPIAVVLYQIFVLCGWFLQMGASALGWVLDPVLYGQGSAMDNAVIYELWQQLAGIFNMFFILMLLFSAFSTIFQVDSYNFKKMWLSILLAALLINFSFPIARFIIDVSNVMMFSLLDGTSGTGLTTNILSHTAIENVLFPKGGNSFAEADVAYEIMAIIFVFLISVTIFVLAFLMIIRLMALIIIIMLSPVGFVGSAFPGMSKFSSQWWDALFNYSFFGPIMVFGIVVATKIMGAIGETMSKGLVSKASNVSDMPKYIGEAVYFFIPVMILWIFMGVAKKFSIAGAGAVIDRGQKFSKWVGNLPIRGTKAVWRGSGIPGGAKQTKDKFLKTGQLFGRKVPLYGGSEETARREAMIGGALTNKKPGEGWNSAKIEHERKKVNELRKEWKDAGGASNTDLQEALDSKDKIKAKAAALEMAEKNGFGDNERQRQENYEKSIALFKDSNGNVTDPVLKNFFDDKVKEKHIKMVIESEIKNTASAGPVSRQAVYNKHLKEMSMDKIAGQKGIHGDAELGAYINGTVADAMARSPEAGAAATKNVARAADKLSDENRTLWGRNGVSV